MSNRFDTHLISSDNPMVFFSRSDHRTMSHLTLNKEKKMDISSENCLSKSSLVPCH